MLTQSMLRTLWPRAPKAKVDAIVATAPAVFAKYGLTKPLHVAHLMAQIGHENGAGTIVRENMNYSAPRLFEIFGVGHHSAKITREEADQLAHHPQEISERVYGLGNPKKAKELGNTRPGDGFRFRGNGDLQLTGGDSHKHIGDLIGIDLYDNPEQLQDPAISFRCAVAEFVALKCLSAADADNVDLVTVRVNGGRNGLAERKVWLRKWKAALAEADMPAAAPEENQAAPPPVSEAIDNANQVPPPEEPRGGESDPAKPMTQSTIGNGATVGGGLSLAGIAAMIWEKLQELPGSVMDALIAAAQRPSFWVAIGVVGVFGFVYWRRHLMKERGGV